MSWRDSRPWWAWCLLGLVLMAGALAGHFIPARWIDWQPELALQQPWRIWSAAFVHFSTMHIAGNLAGLALTCAFGWAAGVRTDAALAWLLAWPLTHLGLWAEPGLRHYGGLSGVIHAGVSVVAAQLIHTGNRAQRAVGVAVLIGLAVKIASEGPWHGPLLHSPGWDIAIAPMAHLTGLIAGLLSYALISTWQAFRPRRAPAP